MSLGIVVPNATPTRAEPEAAILDSVFSALADPVRRSILEQLDGEDLLVSQLADPFSISLQAVSRHIQVLVKAGLVTQERTGPIRRCRLDVGPIYQGGDADQPLQQVLAIAVRNSGSLT
jgi:DNA-binding transcriptional ArsR family regulator